MGIFVKIFGYSVLTAGFFLIAAGMLGVYMRSGFDGLQDLLSPYNIWNLGALAITLAPGLVLIWLGDQLIARQSTRK